MLNGANSYKNTDRTVVTWRASLNGKIAKKVVAGVGVGSLITVEAVKQVVDKIELDEKEIYGVTLTDAQKKAILEALKRNDKEAAMNALGLSSTGVKSAEAETLIDTLWEDLCNGFKDNIIDDTKYPPQEAKYKVYIMDEVHMLSTGAVNAFLKTLEEPPAYVKFILATTDPQKIPTTVLSRCLQFQLKALSIDEIASQIEKISHKEGFTCESEAAILIARAARGSMRDALSLCDQALALGNGKILRDTVLSMLGTASDELVSDILSLLLVNSNKSLEEVLAKLKELGHQLNPSEEA